MLVTMKEILDHANQGNYAVIAPNVGHELNTRPVIEAAEELNSPLIIDVAFGATPDIVFFGEYLVKLCKESSVPICINLDHGGSKDAPFEEVLEQVLLAIKAGFTSVMADRSSKPYEQNVAEVKRLADLAHTLGVTVEAELGHVGSANMGKRETTSTPIRRRQRRILKRQGLTHWQYPSERRTGRMPARRHRPFNLSGCKS